MPAPGYRLGWEGDWSDQPPTIHAYVGMTQPYTFNFLDGAGDEVDLTGYTLTAQIVDANTGSPYISSGTVTAVAASRGLIQWTRSAWSVAATVRLTIRAVSGGTTLIAGPVVVEVRSR